MSVAYVLIGFLVGQIITLEGIRLSSLMTWVFSLLLVGLFTVLPVLSLLSIAHFFQISSNPALLMSVSIVVTEGIRCFLYFIDTPRQARDF